MGGKGDRQNSLRIASPVTGKPRDAGLGVYPEVPIADARDKALTIRRLVDAGKDPIEERDREQQASSIAAAALTFEKAARRTRQRMHAVMQWAWAHGHIAANPVSAVDHILPKQNARKEHRPAMPWRDVPEFVKTYVAEFKQGEATRAAVLFLILTAARSGEMRGAVWDEFDLEAGIWTIPGERMKAKEPYRVPLSASALALVKTLKEQKLHKTLVFPSPRAKVVSDTVFTSFLRRVKTKSDTPGRVATAHGFRDWASEHGYARDLAERALAHTVANKVEAAYHRTDLLEQRRPMMKALYRHVLSLD